MGNIVTFNKEMLKIRYIVDKTFFKSATKNKNFLDSSFDSINNFIFKASAIPAKDIQNAITPIIKTCKIFISYDHSDSDIADDLYNVLTTNGYNNLVFLDSLFWQSMDKTCCSFLNKNNPKSLNLQDVMKAKSTFDGILSNSIIETILNCACFIFIDTSNSSKTFSPWIYLENSVVSKCKSKTILLEDFDRSITMSKVHIDFPLSFDGFYDANSKESICKLLKNL